MRPCPRIKMGGGWEGAIWQRRRVLSSFGPALHIPLSVIWASGLFLQDSAPNAHGLTVVWRTPVAPPPSINDDQTFLKLQVDACSGNLAESWSPSVDAPAGQRARGPCGSPLYLSLRFWKTSPPTAFPQPARSQTSPGKTMGCAELVCRTPSSLHHSVCTLIPLCSFILSTFTRIII